ncbi:hypothetical protein PVAP13_8KG057500 [Panicum virgatum]|uniref:Uncharacterized protein n=1 Tax=Panicum virgatum TaxID=38727 RepID=A0A8T0PIX7_PANVG|nr:hypothetical protein PVAP13_8KG057500 [Panicum virgatum]
MEREYVLSGRCAAVMENGRPAARNFVVAGQAANG